MTILESLGISSESPGACWGPNQWASDSNTQTIDSISQPMAS